ncbi:MAG: hypothetical protein RQ745_07105 [Longimicrobiales bacterium]|nr:hypothetical protein [Longimicrobiales bacterium]
MTPADARGRPEPLGRAVALTLALVAALVALDLWTTLRLGRQDEPLLYVLERLFTFLPLGAALVVGQARRLSMRSALVVCLAATALMAAQDLAPPGETTVRKREVMYSRLEGVWTEVAGPDLTRWVEGRTLPIGLAYLAGRIPQAGLTFEGYGEASPRLHVTYGLMKLAYLLAPFVAIGFVLGARAWAHRNLMFRTRGGERTLLFVVAWAVGPAAATLVAGVTDAVQRNLLIEGPLALILLPAATLAAIAALGWRAAAREAAETAEVLALPGRD